MSNRSGTVQLSLDASNKSEQTDVGSPKRPRRVRDRITDF